MSREQEQHGVSGLGFADNCEVLPGQWPATLDEGPVSARWPLLDRRAVLLCATSDRPRMQSTYTLRPPSEALEVWRGM